MKRSIFKVTCLIVAVLTLLTIMPSFVNAAENNDAVIFEKENGDKIIYISGKEDKEFTFALSNTDNKDDALYESYIKDINGKNVAFIEAGKSFKYLFVKLNDDVIKIELDKVKSINAEEAKIVENLTKIIPVDFGKNNSEDIGEDGTKTTKSIGKIILKNDATYKYQVFEIIDKNSSTSVINENALDLYNKVASLNSLNSMYDKLSAEIIALEDYNKLVENAELLNVQNSEILENENAVQGEKFVVLIQKINKDSIITDVQFMNIDREDFEGKIYKNDEVEKKVKRETALPVTGENIALYSTLGAIVIAIIIAVIRMKKLKNNQINKNEK